MMLRRGVGKLTEIQDNPKVAVEVLLGHGECHIIAESSYKFRGKDVRAIINRIVPGKIYMNLVVVPQDSHLAENQNYIAPKCGDNGIFKGMPVTDEEKELAAICKELEEEFPYDGKYILDKAKSKLIICQSHTTQEDDERLRQRYHDRGYETVIVNPLGQWTGGPGVDSGATNRKLGSDMAQSVTGGGLHGKDLSKADVSVNIYAWLKAQEGTPVEMCCAIGDSSINNIPFTYMVDLAKQFIKQKGGFEEFAATGLL